MRVWDLRKPFRPLLDKGVFKHCRCVTWVPNGAACLGGACIVHARLKREQLSSHD